MSKVVFIAGATRSGTTLADILLGNLPGFFSCGELMYFSTNGLLENEYCACGKRVKECGFWKLVAEKWDKKRVLDLEEYNRIYFSYLKNKSVIKFLIKRKFTDGEFKIFQQDTLSLYEIIWSLNDNKIIVDSSKSPYRLILLKSIGLDVEVLHIVRDLRGVLFSAMKELKQDASAGIEKHIKPRQPLMVALKWFYINILVGLFSVGLKRSIVYFNQMLENPSVICNLYPEVKNISVSAYERGGPFSPGHIVAGGRVRMQKEVFVNRDLLQTEKWTGKGPVNWVVSILERRRWD